MTFDHAQLAALGIRYADALEFRGVQGTAIIRRLAQAVAQIETSSGGACPTCRGPVIQPPRGRRRRFCSTRCRQAHYRATKQRRNETMETYPPDKDTQP